MRKAFTLIEILVVATIIGLLAAGAAVSYTQFMKQSRDAKRKADLEQIRAALEMYRSNSSTSNYPSYNPISVGCITDTGNCSTYNIMYLPKVPKDPKDPTYTYGYSGSSTDYTLGAYLEVTGSSCSSPPSCTIGNCTYCLGPYGQK